ncbi:MAG TPA: hypothetical protein VH088_14810 [Terriglobales bacterium]|jgi:hypothetical protein|nr:hypothetical protein [Terriglobales bacterium]
MNAQWPLLLFCLWLLLPGSAQETPHNPDAIDKSVHNSVDPVSLYFADPLKPAPIRQTVTTPFAPFHWPDRAQPITWFQPQKYSPPPIELLVKPGTNAGPKLPLMPLPPPASQPAPASGFSNPFFIPSFSRPSPFHYQEEPKTKSRKPRRSTPPPSAR